ncbi:MAG: hypothetical protein J6T00_06115 [Bacteroidaceae bacterium]|nr:hypothetical protein [Bacteroidaceae bacterium]
MKKILVCIIGWLSALSMAAQFNFFDYKDTLNLIGNKHGFSELLIDYGVNGDGKGCMIEHMFYHDVPKEKIQSIKSIFMEGMTKSKRSLHGEIHQDGKDSLRMFVSDTMMIAQEDNYKVMGMNMEGCCTTMAEIEDIDLHDEWGRSTILLFGCFQDKASFEHVKESSLRMDKTLTTILKEHPHKTHHVVFGPRTDISFQWNVPNPYVKKDTKAVIYQIENQEIVKDLYQQLLTTAYAHLDYQERFALEIWANYNQRDHIVFSVLRPQKPGYITWAICLDRRKLSILRAEGDEGINIDDNWFFDDVIQSHSTDKLKSSN